MPQCHDFGFSAWAGPGLSAAYSAARALTQAPAPFILRMGQTSSGVGKKRRHILQYTFPANFDGQSGSAQ